MFESRLPSPLLFVTDCSQPPPEDVVEEFLEPSLIEHAARLDPLNSNALLWSRLLIRTVPFSGNIPFADQLKINDDYSGSISFAGEGFSYAKVESQGGWVAVAMSALPVFLSFKIFDATEETKELVRLRFSVIFNNWVDRQENPELAFYHLWALKDCLAQRRDPTVRIFIGDDDLLTVRGSSVMLRETFQFWTSAYWICAVQGPALTTLLTEIRKPEKTIELLRSQRNKTLRDY